MRRIVRVGLVLRRHDEPARRTVGLFGEDDKRFGLAVDGRVLPSSLLAFTKGAVGVTARRSRGCMRTHARTGGKSRKLRNVEMTPVIVMEGAHRIRLGVIPGVVSTGGRHGRWINVGFRLHAGIKYHAIMKVTVVVPVVVRRRVTIGHITSMMISHVRMMVWRRGVMMIVLRFNGWSV